MAEFTLPKDTSLNKRSRPVDDLIRYVLFVCASISILTTAGIIFVLGNEALNFFRSHGFIQAGNSLIQAIEPDETVIRHTTSGQTYTVGDMISFAEREGTEILLITDVPERGVLIVERGYEGTTPSFHGNGSNLFKVKNVTLVEFFTGQRWQPQIAAFGFLPLLVSTVIISVIGLLVAVPIGLGAAIYMSEYASERARSILKPTLEILAGIPTVVLGYFALTFMTPLLRAIFGVDVVQVYNMASAGIVVGFMLIPLVATVSEDALRAVPRSLREASFALGATRFETSVRVLVPSALSGILAAIILAMSRAFGETMIVAVAAGAGPMYPIDFNPFKAAETITGHIARISTGDLSYASMDYNSLFSLGLVLFVVTLALNLLSNYISARFREVYQ
ncbi:phosphate ABC transporter permease subunit PstC [Aggregatilineales bacterium SYSU G02658]